MADLTRSGAILWSHSQDRHASIRSRLGSGMEQKHSKGGRMACSGSVGFVGRVGSGGTGSEMVNRLGYTNILTFDNFIAMYMHDSNT